MAAIGLVPFQINPHYVDTDPAAPTWARRARSGSSQFLECNDVPVVGLREGSWLQVSGDEGEVGGDLSARLFRRGHEPVEMPPGAQLGDLLATAAHFDT